MKINELIKTPLTDFRKEFNDKKSIDIDIIYFMHQRGFMEMGSGSYGSTFTHPKLSYIIKLFSTMDHGYNYFLKYAMSHQSIHLPIFVGKPVLLVRGIKAVRMEKLEKFRDYELGSDIRDYFYDLCRHNEDVPTPLMKQYLSKEFFEILRDLAKVKATPDLGANNLMLRGSTIVITDPLT